MIKHPYIHIDEYSWKIDSEVDSLSKFQKWICKVFKISPSKKYYYTVRAKYSVMIGKAYVGDNIVTGDNNHWRVVAIKGGEITLKNLQPLLTPGQIVGDAIYYSNSYAENATNSKLK
jgi:hypothetical protein